MSLAGRSSFDTRLSGPSPLTAERARAARNPTAPRPAHVWPGTDALIAKLRPHVTSIEAAFALAWALAPLVVAVAALITA